MHHRKQPGAAHHAFMRDIGGISDKYGADGMPAIERIAVLSQLIGWEIAALPADVPYSSAEVLQSVAANIEQGNRAASGKTDDSGLLGFGGRQ